MVANFHFSSPGFPIFKTGDIKWLSQNNEMCPHKNVSLIFHYKTEELRIVGIDQQMKEWHNSDKMETR